MKNSVQNSITPHLISFNTAAVKYPIISPLFSKFLKCNPLVPYCTQSATNGRNLKGPSKKILMSVATMSR